MITNSVEPICAEIAGVVLDVVVAVGDQVRDGDHVVVLESMKMEIPIIAETDGVVSSINVGVGATVALAEVVATISRPSHRD